MTDHRDDRGSRASKQEPLREMSVREAAGRDLFEARILVDRVYREYRESGGRVALEELLRREKNLPWESKERTDTG